ncbi:MAG TPA: S41 family peptidase [Acidobacteriota bacterium]|nr:S41 family peptidase [Acidobacteriota bacterium]
MNRINVIRRCGRRMLLSMLFATLLTSNAISQSQPETPLPLQKADVAEIIDSVLTAIETHYVYPDTARALSKHIREKHAKGAYDDITDLRTIAGKLSDDVRAFTHDRHMHISVMTPGDSPAIGDTLTDDEIARRAGTNFGFRKAEWLIGNVGYLRIDRFDDAVFAGEAASAAMNFLARCSAVIIDLRYNGGGHETMVRFLASYFFQRPTQINALYFTETDSLEQSWTSAHVPGRKLVDTDLYILISNLTASGAEAFSYGLKHAGRAVLVGETTAGAAHWTEYWNFPNLQIRAAVPIARPINPVTKTSWERTGVTPHIEASIGKALPLAHLEALRRIMARTTDEQERKELTWNMAAVRAQAEPVNVAQEQMPAYTGEFADGQYVILIKDDALYWRYVDGTEFILVPLTTDLFGFDDTDDYRVEIIRDGKGVVTGFRLLIRGGEAGPIRPRTGDL